MFIFPQRLAFTVEIFDYSGEQQIALFSLLLLRARLGGTLLSLIDPPVDHMKTGSSLYGEEPIFLDSLNYTVAGSGRSTTVLLIWL
jgi:hypothetical protein